jgi:hypothetical protein
LPLLADNKAFAFRRELFTLYHHDAFVPLEEKTMFFEKDIFYHHTEKWEQVPYIFPEGGVIGRDVGEVFGIWPTH